MKPARFTKHYDTPGRAAAAARHYEWLDAHAQALRQPLLTEAGPVSLTFVYVEGRHAAWADLPRLAALLGDAHGTAWADDLHRAVLDKPHTCPDGVRLDDFCTSRSEALKRRLQKGYLHDTMALRAMLMMLEEAAEGPAAFYKDSNPRNFLITDDDTVYAVDTDDLTLAPFGYDLGKLIVTLTMTYGPGDLDTIEAALASYNEAAARHSAQIGEVRRKDLEDFLALHSVLNAPYAGRNGYAFDWPHRLPHPRQTA